MGIYYDNFTNHYNIYYVYALLCGKKLAQIYQQLHWTSIEKQSIVLVFFSIKVAKYNIIIIYSTFLFYLIFMFKNLANENVYYKNAVYRLTKFYAPSVINEITKEEKKYDFHFYVNTHYFLRFVY